MASQLRWGIIGAGGIARQFAEGLKTSKTGTLVATGSRAIDKANKFAEKHGGKGFGSYEEVYNHPDVDAVYIATPHHLHMEHTIQVAQAGKAILCEKPFTLNALEAERALEAVDKAGVFFMEAFMYRTTPVMAKVREWIKTGAIGDVKLVESSFAFKGGEDWDNFRNDPEVGGGGLMDVGTYCVSLSREAFGEEPSEAFYISQRSAKGVDWIASGMLRFSGDRSAVFQTGVGIVCRNDAVITGTAGRIVIDNPWKQGDGTMRRYEGWNTLVEELPLNIENAALYGIEADTVAEYIDHKEFPPISKQDTLAQMRTLDKLRASAGITFGAELKA